MSLSTLLPQISLFIKAASCLLVTLAIDLTTHAQDHKKDSALFVLTGKATNTNFAFLVRIPQLPEDVRTLRRIRPDLYILAITDSAQYFRIHQSARWMLPANNNWKMSPPLLQRFLKSPPASLQPLPLLIGVKNTRLFRQTHEAMHQLRIRRVYEASGALLVEAPFHWIVDAALSDTNIHFLSIAAAPFTERELTGFDMGANKVNALHRYYPELNGQGLLVSIKENLMDTTDIDLTGRYIPTPPAATSTATHATNMATIIAGAGNSFYTGKGVAWGSNYSSSDFVNLLPDPAQEIEAAGIIVQNHSYGTGIENFYGSDAAAYDQQAQLLPWLQHVFSAGNAGTATSSTGPYSGIPGYSNLTGSFKMSKNSISVGAMDSSGLVLPASSKGPAYDGRLKPELVAFGEDGSSGAAAIVSGLSLLIHQAFLVKTGQLAPSALIRATLFNSADDVESIGIDHRSGYGKVNALESVKTIREDRFYLGSVTEGEVSINYFNVPANTTTLKVTLAWTDAPGQPNTALALVNDLDLELVHTATGQSWQPWLLSTTPHPDSLARLPVRGRDSLNNSEQVWLDLPLSGDYQVRVRAHTLQTNTQQYAISWGFDTTGSFLFTYPVKGDNITSGSRARIRWQGTLTGTGRLEYSEDGGQNWLGISNTVDVQRKESSFDAPDSYKSLVFRMVVGNRQFLSDTVGLSRELDINTGFNCIDSFMIHWQQAPGIQNYQVYHLENNYLQPFRKATDTLLVLPKTTGTSTYFTVAPILPFGLEGRKSYTFNYESQLLDCYLRSFLADPAENLQARISFSLGTVRGVRNIQVQRWDGTRFVTIYDAGNTVSVNNSFLVPAQAGVNLYRGLIVLENGQTFITQTETVYLFNEQSVIIFPNPVTRGQNIRILTEVTDEWIFELYDLTGRNILRKALTDRIQDIGTSRLSPGVYLYNIHDGSTRLFKGKLVIQ